MVCTRVFWKPLREGTASAISPHWRGYRCDARDWSRMPKSAENSISEYRVLGSTGERVSPIGIGGWDLGPANVYQQLSLRIVLRAIDRGGHFRDNAWDYNGFGSQVRPGKTERHA